MAFCLLPKLAEQFKEKLKSGELDPVKLSEMTSRERRDVFAEFMGEANARKVNAMFESKLLLKNQQQGMITWAKQVAGLKPEIKRDIASKVSRLEKALEPEEQVAFLEDLVSQRLGADITLQEAAKITEMSKDVIEKKEAIPTDSPIGSQERMAYGRAEVAIQDYISDLKNETKKLSLAERLQPRNYFRQVSDLAGLGKSLKATLDNSVIGRQGWKVAFTHPGVYIKNSLKTFQDMYNTYGGKDVMTEIKADVMSRPNALNGEYKKHKLDIGVTEEAFPTSLPAKVPYFGKIFKASENAFTGFQYRSRADIFDKLYEIAERSGVEDISGIGNIANSLTGRGVFQQRGEAAVSAVNNLFFSPRLVKSHIDLLTLHAFDKGISPFARKQAALNLLKVVSGISAILTIANAFAPDSVEKDSRSSDFGKIRIKDTRIDVTGGMSSLVTLATRLMRQSTKSSMTGEVKPLNERDSKGNPKFGATTGTDVVFNFFTNKLSPAASVVKDIIQGADFGGNKPTLLNELKNFTVPLPLTTYDELRKNPNSANILLAMILDGLGFAANTYSPKEKK